MPQQYQIRPLTLQYVDKVVALSRRLERDPTPCSYWGLDQNHILQLLSNPQKHSLIAVTSEQVVGIATLTRGRQFQQHLAEVSVAVCPEHRKLGIARHLLQRLEAHTSVWGVELLKALIWVDNQPSRQLFASMGFEHRATLYAEFKSPEFGEMDDCVYYKRLAR
ncbi:MAG: hypothetical protein KatS3mg057_0674 [Herpetosiphonaceae bacterium]|nr:MAG: hypothetical protein KatS3mg057_0674 [Herpetosiphonaceae bacterium]